MVVSVTAMDDDAEFDREKKLRAFCTESIADDPTLPRGTWSSI